MAGEKNKNVEKMIADTFNQLADFLESGEAPKASVAVTALGSEHGEDVIYEAAKMAADRGVSVKVIGSKDCDYKNIEVVKASDDAEGHKLMEELLDSGRADGAVTMHYPFPIGVSTVGRVITPSAGREMYIATTTGTSSTDRIEGMVKNAIYGIVTAKACGIENPTIGILNVDGARQTETALKKLAEGGYDITFAASGRADGGCVMRGNDLLTASCDVMVTDPLTGNILMKMFSAYNTGGSYEAVGYGYGPGIGDFDKLVLIISRASGAPVIRGAIEFAGELVRGSYQEVYKAEMAKAKKAGLDGILAEIKSKSSTAPAVEEVKAPDKEIVTEEIPGIEIMDLEDAVKAVWAAGIYAESGMGCTGPVVLVNEAKAEKAREILVDKGFLGS